MAFMGQTTESNGDQQLIDKKQKKSCCECCAACCTSCTQCLSGLLLLLTIAGLVLCIRIFLEFPVILNGFRNTVNFTKESVEAFMDVTTQSPVTEIPPKQETCKMFVCSFKLLNETNQLQRNETSTVHFTAYHIQTMLNKTFSNSLLNAIYRNASVFLLRQDTLMVHFQLLLCNDSSSWSGIKADSVVQVLRSYNKSQQTENSIAINQTTVTVGDLAPCPPFLNAAEHWPWQAILKVNDTPICIGSLLTAFWVLSSGNCVKNRNISSLRIDLKPGSVTLYTGSVEKIVQHPNFTVAPVNNNVALIRLSKPVWFSPSLVPMCLPQTSQDPATGRACNGSTGDFSTVGLKILSGTVSSALTCLNESRTGNLHIKTNLAIKTVTQMDIGNALVCMNTADNTSYIQGIAPYSSIDGPLSWTCLSYASIGPAIGWIQSYILN